MSSVSFLDAKIKKRLRNGNLKLPNNGLDKVPNAFYNATNAALSCLIFAGNALVYSSSCLWFIFKFKF